MVAIALGSSDVLADGRTSPVWLGLLERLAPWASPATLAASNVGLRKLGHVIEYGILAILWYRALTPSPHAATTAFLVATVYGGLDELWQGLHPSRTPALGDVIIDAGGALLGLLAWTGPWRAAWLEGAAWGVGALAGIAGLVVGVDLALGRPAAALAVAAVGLGLVAAGLGCLARRTRIRVSSASRAPAPP
jgi:VanZ family protein